MAAVYRFACVACLALAVLPGCEPQSVSGRLAVRGSVLWNAEPLQSGALSFLPASGSGGLTTGAVIKDGRFAIPAEQGLPPGTYLVRISSPVRVLSKPASPPTDSTESLTIFNSTVKELLPDWYNLKTSLKVEVTAQGKNQFDFALTD